VPRFALGRPPTAEVKRDLRYASSVGTVCVYQATSPEKIREHASRADLPADEIIPIADTVLVRPDPD